VRETRIESLQRNNIIIASEKKEDRKIQKIIRIDHLTIMHWFIG